MGWHDFLSCPEESFIFNSVTYLALVSSLITKQYTNKFLAVEHRDSWKLSFFFFFLKSKGFLVVCLVGNKEWTTSQTLGCSLMQVRAFLKAQQQEFQEPGDLSCRARSRKLFGYGFARSSSLREGKLKALLHLVFQFLGGKRMRVPAEIIQQS